jgi:hypothetical protein
MTMTNPYVKGSAPITTPGTSYIVEVHGIGDQNWTCNGVRHPTREAAEVAGSDLFSRWYGIDDWRVVPSDDQPNR